MVRTARLACLVLAIVGCRGPHGEPSAEPVDARAVPEQIAVGPAEAGAASATLEGARLTPLARYKIAARVLSAERYYLGWRGRVSPVDLALGWAALSDPNVDRFVDWHQSGRWYFWQWSAGSPFQNEAIREQSANVHMIAATRNLRRALLALDSGDVVEISGWLVDVTGPDGERWTSSLSRADTGDTSCEVLYANKLIAGGRMYR